MHKLGEIFMFCWNVKQTRDITQQQQLECGPKLMQSSMDSKLQLIIE